MSPVSRQYGFDRGLPIDRFYIEDFLRRHSGAPGYARGDIRGRVLEIGGDEYSRRFGHLGSRNGSESPIRSVDVLHVDGSSTSPSTMIGDLVSGAGIPADTYDTVICTQTLHVIFDVAAAVETLRRSLRPGGIALVTVPGITKTCRPDRDLWGDYWRFTSLSATRLFQNYFPADTTTVDAYGNLLSAVAFLHGLAAEDLTAEQLMMRDPDYEVLIAIRAVKAPSP